MSTDYTHLIGREVVARSGPFTFVGTLRRSTDTHIPGVLEVVANEEGAENEGEVLFAALPRAFDTLTPTPPVKRTLTREELFAEAEARFGPDQGRWAYQCPVCSRAATGADVQEFLEYQPLMRRGRALTHLNANQVLAQNCISCETDAVTCATPVVQRPAGSRLRVFDLAPA